MKILPLKKSWKWPVLLGCAAAVLLAATPYTVRTLWPTEGPAVIGGDDFGGRYYHLRQITKDNVTSLKCAWSITAGDNPRNLHGGSAFEASPIFYRGNLIVVTTTGMLLCVDGATGNTVWRFKPAQFKGGDIVTKRGASLWNGAAVGETDRIFYSYGRWLLSVDAVTGQPTAGFGVHGAVPLIVRPKSIVSLTYNSPPLVAGNRVLCGSMIPDNATRWTPEGLVTAFDCVTGAILWNWEPVLSNTHARPDQIIGSANVWATMSYDAALDAVYACTSSPSNDSYGGTRPGNNEFADSIVCLDLDSGKLRWARQLVHHNLWDYDLPAQPLLFDFRKAGTQVHAVAVATKMGFLFLFDRVSGQPLFPIREVPVPQSQVPGEVSSPTQPRPDAPPPLCLQGLKPSDAWGATPELQAAAATFAANNDTGALFIPPSLRGTIECPGTFGGMNWSGMAFDPENQLILATSNNFATYVKLFPKPYLDLRSLGVGHEGSGNMLGTPYEAIFDYSFVNGIPWVKPPWGTISAIDPATGTIRWQKPLGYIPAASAVPNYLQLGSPNLGGAITTSTGLTFVAGTLDHHLRALDTATGQELASLPLPFGGQALPVIYKIRGKEYVAICCGGHFAIDRTFGDQILAFTL